MAVSNESPKSRRRVRSGVIWPWLNRGTARFYAALRYSVWGRFMTGYRNDAFRSADKSSYAEVCRTSPASPARERLIGAVESCGPVRGARALFSGLFDCPTACYGLFWLLYGLFSMLIYALGPRLLESFVRNRGNLIVSIALSAAACPLLFSRRTLAESIGHSAIASRFLVGFFAIPRDRLTHTGRRFPQAAIPPALGLSCLLGALASVATLVISPWVIPAVLLAIALVGAVFAYPETGVILVTLMLPLVWLDQKSLVWVVALILLTWCSFGLKLLTRHCTMRFGPLEWVLLILGGLILAMGFTGRGVCAESIWQSVALAVCLSAYFLLVNLVNTRALVRRCLMGVGISVVVVTALAYVRRIPVESLLWLEGSRAGNAIIDGVHNAVEQLSQLWVDHSELYLVLAFSWIYAYMLHTKRLLRKFLGALFIFLELFLIIMTRSVSALLCVALMTVLFLLMLGNKWLSAAILALPATVCGACWLQYLYPVSDRMLTTLSRSRLYKTQLSESLWRMVWDHPAGIGVGDRAFAMVYPAYAAPDLGGVTDCGSVYFEILLNYGWPGLLEWAAVAVLFIRKSFSALSHVVVGKDRAMILGGVTSFLGLMIFGCVRSFITSPRVFFTVILVMALCSAYENILFEERAVDLARWQGSDDSENRLYRSGQFSRDRLK